ncbi:hypothetical protein KJ815_02430 [bacterium]|nr:hypothetical protein [bacterium]
MIFIAFVLAIPPAFAGGSIFSPNGVGEELPSGGVRAIGLGGAGIGLADSMSFHSGNPALIAFTPRTLFRMSGHIGWWGTSADGRHDADAETVWRDFGLYFPVSSRWSVGIAANPSRHVDLNTFSQRIAQFNDTNFVHYEMRDVWQGSTVDLRLENGVRLCDKVAVGLSVVYTILNNSSKHTIDLDQIVRSSYYLDAASRQNETFRGWTADVGVHVQPTARLGIGIVYRPRSTGEWTYEFEKSRSDSIARHERSGGSPGYVKAGISYRFSPRVVGVMDVQSGQWSSDDLGALADVESPGTVVNPLFLSFGVERLPERSAIRSGFTNWGLRSGAFYRKHYWPKRNGAVVEDVGITFGLSAPLVASTAYLHWANEIGFRGLDENKLGAKETFFRTALEIEVSEKWFQRTRPRIPK